MAKRGRPRKFSKKRVKEIQWLFQEYIDNNDVPIIAEFAYTNGILRESLYDYPEFSTLLKMCIAKKESQLEKLTLSGKINAPMAIFSLKQLGWTDKEKIEHSGGISTKIEIIDPSNDCTKKEE